MRPWILMLVIGALLLTACGAGAGRPAVVPTAAVGGAALEASEDNSPRVGPGNSLPPTWTPAPTDVPATPIPSATQSAAGQPQSGESAGESYVVVAGDTLGEIAELYGVTVEALVDANDIDDIDRIEVGQVLIIPLP